MRRARLVLFLVAAAAPAARRLPAQWQLTADAGAARIQQTDIPLSNAQTFGLTVDAANDRAWFRSSGLAAHGDPDRWTAQGVALGSVLGAPGRVVRWELTGALTTFGQSGELPTSSGELMARARFGAGPRGAAVGLGGGSIAHEGGWTPLYHAQGDTWWSADADQFGASVLVVHAGARSYGDLATTWRRDAMRGGISLSATAGLRNETHPVQRSDAWATAEATAWLAPQAAVVVSAGRTLEDVVRGIPSTRFVSVALRFAAQPHATAFHKTERRGPALTIEVASEGRRRIDVRGIDEAGARVELMSDFTDWMPVALDRIGGGVWRLERPVTAGLHRVALRIDGGEWTVPANLPHAADEFGGVVGLITVP